MVPDGLSNFKVMAPSFYICILHVPDTEKYWHPSSLDLEIIAQISHPSSRLLHMSSSIQDIAITWVSHSYLPLNTPKLTFPSAH